MNVDGFEFGDDFFLNLEEQINKAKVNKLAKKIRRMYHASFLFEKILSVGDPEPIYCIDDCNRCENKDCLFGKRKDVS